MNRANALFTTQWKCPNVFSADSTFSNRSFMSVAMLAPPAQRERTPAIEVEFPNSGLIRDRCGLLLVDNELALEALDHRTNFSEHGGGGPQLLGSTPDKVG